MRSFFLCGSLGLRLGLVWSLFFLTRSLTLFFPIFTAMPGMNVNITVIDLNGKRHPFDIFVGAKVSQVKQIVQDTLGLPYSPDLYVDNFPHSKFLHDSMRVSKYIKEGAVLKILH